MDGNARWAKKKKIKRSEGYKKGLDKIEDILNICIEKKIKNLTLFALSSENIRRSNINIIFNTIYDNLNNFLISITENNAIKVRVFGSKKNLPKRILKIIDKVECSTKKNQKIYLNIAFNYGSKDELIQCFNNLLIKKTNTNFLINEKKIRENLYISDMPDPDILIRTGGFQRLSNFLLFQLSYTELFFTKTLWPDITKKEILKIFDKYNSIERKYGL
tara:strand:- start:521 stop:1174 length:654 start_codon:yes stop_codon:yes gene_type:complete